MPEAAHFPSKKCLWQHHHGCSGLNRKTQYNNTNKRDWRRTIQPKKQEVEANDSHNTRSKKLTKNNSLSKQSSTSPHNLPVPSNYACLATDITVSQPQNLTFESQHKSKFNMRRRHMKHRSRLTVLVSTILHIPNLHNVASCCRQDLDTGIQNRTIHKQNTARKRQTSKSGTTPTTLPNLTRNDNNERASAITNQQEHLTHVQPRKALLVILGRGHLHCGQQGASATLPLSAEEKAPSHTTKLQESSGE